MSEHDLSPRLEAALSFFLALSLKEALAGDVFSVPVFYADISVSVGANGNRLRTAWSSNINAFNSRSTLGGVSYVAAYGSGFQLINSPTGCPDPYPVPPLAGMDLERLGGCVFTPHGVPGFVALSPSSGVVITAEVERWVFDDVCFGLAGTAPFSQGNAQLPIYKGVFFAQTVTTSGPVVLGSPGSPACGGPDQTYMRRVNVTLFNAGDQDATFTIQVRALRARSEVLYEAKVTLRAKEVRQLNRVPIPVIQGEFWEDYFTVHVWINITSTQPYLSYVSAIFEGGQTGSMPFEVYPSRAEN